MPDNGTQYYKQYCNGDDNGLVELIKEYKNGLIFYINSYVNNFSVAEDITEDTFVLLGIKKPRNSEKFSFKTWLYTIARNKAIDYLRKESKKKEISINECINISDDTEFFEEIFAKSERGKIINDAIMELKEEYRQVLLLRYFEEFSNSEIALIVKKKRHNVEVLISRAREALKKNLERRGFDYEEL